jgi:PKD repeat protein
MTTTNYMVAIDDGCSTATLDTISIFVQPTFNLSFTTSEKQCYGSEGFAHVVANPAANYSYSWNSNPITITDSLIAAVAKEYQVDVKDKTTNCSITDTITIPGFSEIIAAIFTSNTECVSVLDASFQFNDNSAVSPFELSDSSLWDFGDGTTTPYVFSESPQHTYTDTGFFNVILYLENIGGCYDSVSHTICIVPDNRLFIPNSFTPNADYCNDEFYAKGLGGFHTFNIKIHKRWGSEVIFKSDEILISNNSEDGNICNSIISFDSYYKLGSWDGVMLNGLDAPQGVYPYVIHYQLTELTPVEEVVGYIILIK